MVKLGKSTPAAVTKKISSLEEGKSQRTQIELPSHRRIFQTIARHSTMPLSTAQKPEHFLHV